MHATTTWQNTLTRRPGCKPLSRDAVAYIANNNDQAAAWFGERLRVEPRIVTQITVENPVFHGVKKPEDARINVTQADLQRLNDWFAAACENGLIKSGVEPYKP
ncbi:hypothetical protein [Paraburkholderia xenovorans]|uniref:hypothetical protein n=1 Tax=Paraburkholderia xenovorans TaxID=36873 RepID=UPI000AC6D1C2|nr:hypothetical protein [Paraburkholderia xenovorans]